MDVKRGYVMRADQIDPPVVWRAVVPLLFMDDGKARRMLDDVFGPGKTKRLQTWARPTDSPNGPHWIGVRNGTPLHIDPRYPRYTHQLIVLNEGWTLAGMSRKHAARPFLVGDVFCCDTHSPHILMREQASTGSWYLAASIDSPTPLGLHDVAEPLLDFVVKWTKQ